MSVNMLRMHAKANAKQNNNPKVSKSSSAPLPTSQVSHGNLYNCVNPNPMVNTAHNHTPASHTATTTASPVATTQSNPVSAQFFSQPAYNFGYNNQSGASLNGANNQPFANSPFNTYPVIENRLQQIIINNQSIRLENYDGSTDVHDFIEDFEMVASAQNWDDLMKVRQIYAHLASDIKKSERT
jgi:hypothetical protein